MFFNFGFGSSSKPVQMDEVYIDKKNSDLFLENYFTPRIPLLIKGGANNWPLMSKWTKEYIIKGMGKYECTVVTDSRPAASKEKCSLREYFEQHPGKSTLTLEKFNREKPAGFFSDIPLNTPFFSKNLIARYFFFHAPKDAGTLPHFHMDAFNILQQGVKKWILFDADPKTSPEGYKLLQKFHIKYPSGTHAKDWFRKESGKLGKKGLTIYECNQQAGDIVFIPIHYSHAVLNLSEVMGLVVERFREKPGYHQSL